MNILIHSVLLYCKENLKWVLTRRAEIHSVTRDMSGPLFTHMFRDKSSVRLGDGHVLFLVRCTVVPNLVNQSPYSPCL